MDASPKPVRPGRPLQVNVLGGVFQVTEVLVGEGDSAEMVMAAITTMPEERWFVMVAGESEAQQDSLAVIDDDMEFQVLAYGQLSLE